MAIFRKLCFAPVALFVAACDIPGSDDPASTNRAPVLVSANADQSAMVGYDFSYDATKSSTAFSDPDGDGLSYAVSFAPDSNDFLVTDGVISGAPRSAEAVVATITASDSNGGSVSDTFTISVSIDQDAVQAAFGDEIDLAELPNYAAPDVPSYVTKLEDGGNPITDAGAVLGRVLFYDVNLSFNNTFSCASCHMQETAFGDSVDYSFGIDGTEMPRHSSRLINTQYADEVNFFWNERVTSLEGQVTQPIHQSNELGFTGEFGRPGITDLIEKLEAVDYYDELFRFVFFDPEITEERLQIALGQFVKSIVSFDSRWDAGRAQVGSQDDPFPNFTPDENAGKTLFTLSAPQGGAGCAACHRPPEFDIDPNAGHNGVVTVIDVEDEFDFENTRAPTLRDVAGSDGALKGPYMHDGQFDDLRAVIDHYDNIEIPANADSAEFLATLDSRLQTGGAPQSLGLTDTEKDQLVSYLMTLGGASVYSDPKWSTPFPPCPPQDRTEACN